MRTRVASKDWWASRHVVSVTSKLGEARTALASASGPSSRKILRQGPGSFLATSGFGM